MLICFHTVTSLWSMVVYWYCLRHVLFVVLFLRALRLRRGDVIFFPHNWRGNIIIGSNVITSSRRDFIRRLWFSVPYQASTSESKHNRSIGTERNMWWSGAILYYAGVRSRVYWWYVRHLRSIPAYIAQSIDSFVLFVSILVCFRIEDSMRS